MPAAGYFRGTGYCFGYHHKLSKCSRTWLSYLTAHKNQSHLVDAGELRHERLMRKAGLAWLPRPQHFSSSQPVPSSTVPADACTCALG
jgi:hypothetical protein